MEAVSVSRGAGAAWRRVESFCMNQRNLFVVGMLLVLALSVSEVARGRHRNFMIFAESTRMFWSGTAPYGDNWTQAVPHLDYFLYGPLFNILFAPFAFMPAWLGPVVWNLFNFTLWFAAVFTLPAMSRAEKCRSFMYTFLILACTQLSFQYNVAVGYMFLFAYTLLERGRGFWAVLLIMISGFTKIYGFFALGLLLLYPPPQIGRNMLYVAVIAVAFALAPAVNMPLADLPAYYGEWFSALMSHKDTRTWMTVFYMRPLGLLQYRTFVQAGVLLLLAAGLLANLRFRDRRFLRLSALAVMMGYVILFSNSSESHTYVITLIGYMVWYHAMMRAGMLRALDRFMFWAVLAVVVVMPVDVLCPPAVMRVFYDAQINMWLLLVLWLRICYTAFVRMPSAFRAAGQNVNR